MFKIKFLRLVKNKIIISKSFYFAKQALATWRDRSKHIIYRVLFIIWAILICLRIKSFLTDFVSVFEQNILLGVQNSHPIFEDMNKISLYSRRNNCSARYLTWKLPSCSPEINLLQTLSVMKERAGKTKFSSLFAKCQLSLLCAHLKVRAPLHSDSDTNGNLVSFNKIIFILTLFLVYFLEILQHLHIGYRVWLRHRPSLELSSSGSERSRRSSS